MHKFRGGLKYPNLVLKRGVTYEDALLKWFLDQETDRDERGNVTLNLLGDDGQQVRTWSFAGAFPVKWSGPSFNAKSTNVATETLEIAHQGLDAAGLTKDAAAAAHRIRAREPRDRGRGRRRSTAGSTPRSTRSRRPTSGRSTRSSAPPCRPRSSAAASRAS